MYNIAQGNTPQMPTNDQLSELGLDFLRRCFDKDPARRASAAELLQHEWILNIRSQMDLEPTPQTPASEGGNGGYTPISATSSHGSSRLGNEVMSA
jgi:mitogen-activated protein kinase kinase kinase